MERFQIFEGGTGKQVDSATWGLEGERETPLMGGGSGTADVKMTQDMLYACLTQGDGPSSIHEAIIDMAELRRGAISAGLGAGYIAWRVTGLVSGRSLLGFPHSLESLGSG